MSRRSVLITLRDSEFSLSLSNLDNKFYLLGLNFIKVFKQLLLKKNVLVIDSTLNYSQNALFISANFFFTTRVLKNYKRSVILLSSQLQQTKNQSLENSFKKLFKKLNCTFKTNILALSFTLLNKFYDKKLVNYLFKKFKPYVFVLFKRRFNLYIDFLKLTSLYCISKIDIGTYLYVVTTVFRYLQKKSHTKFLTFFTQLIQYTILINKKKLKISNLTGITLVINGRLKGKTRSDSRKIQIGSVPTQTISKRIEYAKRYTFTKKFGVFGFKMWVYKV